MTLHVERLAHYLASPIPSPLPGAPTWQIEDRARGVVSVLTYSEATARKVERALNEDKGSDPLAASRQRRPGVWPAGPSHMALNAASIKDDNPSTICSHAAGEGVPVRGHPHGATDRRRPIPIEFLCGLCRGTGYVPDVDLVFVACPAGCGGPFA